MPNSPIDRCPAPYAVAVHDAGAANMIAAWVAAAHTPPKRVFATGPARAIWAHRFGEDAALSDDLEAIKDLACVISGTGWASDFEHRARLSAAAARVHSIAVIDHWVNYAMRFEREGRVQWPDTIWVGDQDALTIAREAFPDTPIERHPSLYLTEQAREAGPVPLKGDVLFLLEPTHSHWGGDRPGEFQALDHFMARKEAAGIASNTPIRLRPHPSDPRGKYDEWLARHTEARLDESPDMAAALRTARWVVGLNSAGLVIALEAGRTVLSALPPNAPPCTLPHKGITPLCVRPTLQKRG